MEKFAGKFRKPIRRRKDILLSIFGDIIKDRTVLELGCGSGGLCFELLNMGAKKVIGVDIAGKAIEAARGKAVSLGIKDRLEFFVSDIRNGLNLPDADFTVGLGFIDYIDIDSLKKLFTRIKGRFIFSFPERKFSIIDLLHYMYLKSQGCPAFYKFRRKEFADTECYFFEKDNMVFITNRKPAQ